MHIGVFPGLRCLCSRYNALILWIKCFAHVILYVGFLVITILSQYNSKNIEFIEINVIVNVWISGVFLSLGCRVHVVMH